MGSKEIFMIMRERDYNELNPEVRQNLLYTEVREANEWETHRNDENYCKLKKAEKKAKNDLQEYLYDKRNNNFKNR
jgi:hypothetical protein